MGLFVWDYKKKSHEIIFFLPVARRDHKRLLMEEHIFESIIFIFNQLIQFV